MNKSFLIAALISFSAVLPAYAAAGIRAEVDKKSVVVGEHLVYKISVTTTDKDQPQIKFPEFKGFRVLSSAQSSSVSFINNRLERSFIYVLIISALESGSLTIPQAQLKIKDQVLNSESFEIEVRAGGVDPEDKPAVPFPAGKPYGSQDQVTL